MLTLKTVKTEILVHTDSKTWNILIKRTYIYYLLFYFNFNATLGFAITIKRLVAHLV